MPITVGVPQGSILALLLFMLYLNYVVNTSNLVKFIIFANDTNLFFKHKDLGTLINTINADIEKQ